MASSPDIQEATLPAVKPERTVDVAPEDIKLGSDEDNLLESSQGKRKLKRPRSSAGTGLQV